MDNKIGIKFTYYRMGTTISRMTELEDMQELIEHGFERVASDCIKEVYNTTGVDLNKLAHPYPATRFCFFSEFSFDTDNGTITESNRQNCYDISKNKEYAS
ncbi:hypothetical protein [Fictibacillus sp. BK138]|uniref:hypothetical protein n=1 Tax=Fictibacillus sp. BK138 TaxID=2512121 RepID=UPI00102881A9|nr:hypothetical protein [Fictibacillus sp. BK138]RZT21340.1 hypothetical protein EV282_0398 [Fictibacillus sp. BK138]